MLGWEITFGQPWYLLLLILAPLLWVLSFKSLAGLGRMRRIIALVLRTLVLVGLVFALAEVQLKRISEKLTVIYLLDQSESIPPFKRQLMLDYVTKEVATHRNSDREDRAGVIVFGRDALIEIQAIPDDLPSVGQIESYRQLRTDATNIAAAIKLAQASFLDDSAKRIVVITDGNENIGNARALEPVLREQGIGLDVVPVELGSSGEVAIQKVVLPSNPRRGQPVETRIVLENYGNNPVAGKLKLSRRLGAEESLLNESDVELKPGKNVFSVQESEIESSGIFTYKATFVPNSSEDDRLTENNETSGFMYVRGKGRILLIEDWEHPNQFDYLVSRLRANELEVDVTGSNELFTSLDELQAYDAVILANVPRSSGDSANNVTNFSDEQIEMLVQNTEHMGCGLIMLGGPNSFGAGGWTNTALEKAMPVDFQVRNSKIKAVGALVLIMHASELADGNYWQKVVSIEAIKALGPMDYCGMIHWDDSAGSETWLWGQSAKPPGMLEAGKNRRMMLARLGRMAPGDMPDFDPGLRMALNSLKGTDAALKHVIAISDGDPTPPSPSVLNSFKQAQIKVTTVAIGAHGQAGAQTLQNIAQTTEGNYYVVTNPRALPKIYQREARRVSRPLIYEPDGGVQPQIVDDHEIHGMAGVQLPSIRGFVLTTVKDNPLVEVSIRSDKPKDEENATVLASWTYGLGRAVAFTSDGGQRWTSEWTTWPQYDKFFTQMVRWAMRPAEEGNKFSISSDVRDGKVRVVVNGLDVNDRFLNLNQLSGTAIGPDLKPFPIRIEQVAPGRYVGEFPADQQGSYYLTVNTGYEEVQNENGTVERRSRPPLITGVNVPYSAEYNDRKTNRALLAALAAIRPQGGNQGRVMGSDLRRDTLDALIRQFNTFRHDLAKAVSVQDVWPLVLLAVACVFFGDVFVRRVTVGFAWVGTLLLAIRRRVWGSDDEHAAAEQRMERLRSRKAAVAEQMDERRAAAKFEPQISEGVDAQQVLEQAAGAAAAPPETPGKARPSMAPIEATEEESYTARLLKAKQQARRGRGESGE